MTACCQSTVSNHSSGSVAQSLVSYYNTTIVYMVRQVRQEEQLLRKSAVIIVGKINFDPFSTLYPRLPDQELSDTDIIIH